MQKIATKVFIYASVAFGVIGILMILAGGIENNEVTGTFLILQKLLFTSVCIILPSFALSVAGKYLTTNNK